MRSGNRKGIDQHVDQAAVFPLEYRFTIAQVPLPLHIGKQRLVLLRRRKNFLPRITMQQLAAAAAAEHAHQCLVHFDEPAVRTAKEQAFLNIVE